MGELSTQLACDPSSATGIVDRLSGRAWCGAWLTGGPASETWSSAHPKERRSDGVSSNGSWRTCPWIAGLTKTEQRELANPWRKRWRNLDASSNLRQQTG